MSGRITAIVQSEQGTLIEARYFLDARPVKEYFFADEIIIKEKQEEKK